MSSEPTDHAGTGSSNLRVPDFFIVGQPKSGTTALYEALRAHPQLYMPDLKEPVFLASDLLAGLRRPTVRARPQNLEEYLALFVDATPGQRIGEASSLYLWSRAAAANIAQLAPQARIIAILREPASLLRSAWLRPAVTWAKISAPPIGLTIENSAGKARRNALGTVETSPIVNREVIDALPAWPEDAAASKPVKPVETIGLDPCGLLASAGREA